MSLACPVGHPSGPGRHCPLCGRAYVPADQVVLPGTVVYPTERVAPVEAFVPVTVEIPVPAPRVAVDDAPRLELEALAMLSSLASDADY